METTTRRTVLTRNQRGTKSSGSELFVAALYLGIIRKRFRG
jgi:hypothetical protein